ncbi:MAG TPA: DHH family phosphoesterase [Verrucomicrobiota bacterium]|nr:phosphoesterase [Verrucomicrobiales bacterium]HRI11905.1 DHH family phosphoesterase [Verrucomicrobiota bacterium]
MAPLSRPEVICTHESDLDGLLAGLLLQRLAKHFFGSEVQLQAWNYQGWKNRTMGEAIAWIADFSFEPRLDRPGWLIVDHHVFTSPPRQAQLVHDPLKSASLLVYDRVREAGLGNATLDRLVQLTNVGDLWCSQDPDFVLALDYASLVKEYGFWNLHKVIGGDPEKILDHPLLEVMGVKRRIENPIGLAWSEMHIEKISPDVGLVQTSIGDTNLIVHQLLDGGTLPYKVLVTLFPKANRTFVASFRSLTGEALPVANRFQGGGHPNAAGATLPRSVTDTESAVAFLRETLAPSDVGRRLNPAFAELTLS